jgi:MotA/TolQ/ExbB proton channel family
MSGRARHGFRLEQLPLERARLALYLICLGIAFALYLLMHGSGAGMLFWLLAGAAIAGAAYGAMTDVARNGGILQVAVLLASLLTVTVPFGVAITQTGKLAGTVSAANAWPQILVLLFASRVLAELAELRFHAAWRDPFQGSQPAPVQSVAAALVLGAFFTLMFYLLAAHLHGKPDAASGIIAAALLGDTAIHYAIVFLFFVIAAFVIDAVVIYIRDRAALGAFRRAVGERGAMAPDELRKTIGQDLARWSHTRAIQFLRDALDRATMPRAEQSALPAAMAGFHQASRRFVKGLVTLLPLLGFLGTVIGLSIALAELPRGAGGGRAAFDIGGSLAGLAIKFETTLLGLMGGMIASLSIALLEKAETELAADCELMVAAAQGREPRNAA